MTNLLSLLFPIPVVIAVIAIKMNSSPSNQQFIHREDFLSCATSAIPDTPLNRIDPKAIIVVDGKIMGTYKDTIAHYLAAQHISAGKIIKAEVAREKYGEQGRFGAIEFTSDKSHSSDNLIFEKVETSPVFAGSDSWSKFILANLDVSIPMKYGAPEGTYSVRVKFIVGLDGSLSDFQAVTNHGYGIEEEVVRVLKKSAPWLPAVQNGYLVKAYHSQSVTVAIPQNK